MSDLSFEGLLGRGLVGSLTTAQVVKGEGLVGRDINYSFLLLSWHAWTPQRFVVKQNRRR